jgi:hypothetical protein
VTIEVDRVELDTELLVDAIIPENKIWLCPVCGVKRNLGNHAKCSKVTQRKHQQERDNQSRGK